MKTDRSWRLRRPALLLALPIVIGLAATAAALSARSADTQFTARQQNLRPVQPASLARLVASAPNPRPGLGQARSTSATCSPRGIGELRNPWRCVVQYTRGGVVSYRVTIAPDGNVSAIDPTGQIAIHGCCIGSRPAQ